MKILEQRITQFLKFSGIGTLGFLTDSGVFYICNLLLGNFYSRLISFFIAVVFTYIFNKRVTFNIEKSECFWKEFPAYFCSMIAGGLVNLLMFFILVYFYNFFSERQLLAIAIGSLSGLSINFLLSLKIFKK